MYYKKTVLFSLYWIQFILFIFSLDGHISRQPFWQLEIFICAKRVNVVNDEEMKHLCVHLLLFTETIFTDNKQILMSWVIHTHHMGHYSRYTVCSHTHICDVSCVVHDCCSIICMNVVPNYSYLWIISLYKYTHNILPLILTTTTTTIYGTKKMNLNMKYILTKKGRTGKAVSLATLLVNCTIVFVILLRFQVKYYHIWAQRYYTIYF